VSDSLVDWPFLEPHAYGSDRRYGGEKPLTLVADQMRRSQRKSDHRRWRDGHRLLWTETP